MTQVQEMQSMHQLLQLAEEDVQILLSVHFIEKKKRIIQYFLSRQPRCIIERQVTTKIAKREC